MIQDAALEALGLDEDASPAEIEQTIERKQSQLQQALDKAPTEALQNKYRDQLAKLNALKAKLLPVQSRAASLSHTKLADLPQSATQFDGGPGAQINLRPGQRLANRYEIKEQIGAGGMGAVYRALDTTTGKEIALKVLLPGLLANERARERFLDEARISQQLSHPHIVNVYDVQQDGDFFFLTMELLEGQDLRQVMENRSLARQPFSEKELQQLAEQLCGALAYAHKYTVHRDLKPENVWLTEDGDYKLMDFGIARVQSTSQRTQTGAAMGTAYYMAPEQLRGQKDIDGRADQYALGVMLYELATSQVPAGLIKPIRQQRKDLTKGFANSVMRTLHTDPAERFADIGAFGQSLQKGGGISLPQLPWKPIGIAAGVLVAILGIGGLVANGSFELGSLKSLLPMSKEEIAAQRASLAKIQGEIKVLKQRLDNARRSLDSDVRDAERKKDGHLAALQHWQHLTEDAIFAGSQLTELEGNLAMAETLLRDNAFSQAGPIFEQVREEYAKMQDNFIAGEALYIPSLESSKSKNRWLQLKIQTDREPAAASSAVQAETEALAYQRNAQFTEALPSWQSAAQYWQKVVEQGEALVKAKTDMRKAQGDWESLKQEYSLKDPLPVAKARAAHAEADQQQKLGKIGEAQASWQESAAHWRAARDAVKSQVARIDSERRATAAAAEAAKAERAIENAQKFIEMTLPGNEIYPSAWEDMRQGGLNNISAMERRSASVDIDFAKIYDTKALSRCRSRIMYDSSSVSIKVRAGGTSRTVSMYEYYDNPSRMGNEGGFEWSDVKEVKAYGGTVSLLISGYPFPHKISFRAEDLAARVEKAIEFLRSSCDKTAETGF